MKHLAALILSYFLIPVGIIILVFTELSRELKLKKIRIYLYVGLQVKHLCIF